MKLCMHCRHFIPPSHGVYPEIYSECRKLTTHKPSPVTGDAVSDKRAFCNLEREKYGGCGPQAIHFEESA